MRYVLILFISFQFIPNLQSQIIEGTLLDSSNFAALIGANIILKNKEDKAVKGVITDVDGKFSIELTSDAVVLEASYVGYTAKTISISDLLSKEESATIYLSSGVMLTNCYLVTASEYYFFNSLEPTEITISNNHAGLAATFDDPSRSLLRYSSTSTANDQTNSIIYRGMPASAVKWTLDGAEIVNPNHLSNAGNFSDRSSASAGGVLSFPFETLQEYQFYPSPLKKSFGNALSGVSNLEGVQDIDGSNSFVKFGFLGLEAAYNNQLSYSRGFGLKSISVHYRYSFVGLLNNLGVSFDNEAIDFQDLFLRTQLLKGEHKLFFTFQGGKSNNNKTRLLDNPLAQQDFQDVSFSSDLFNTGLSYTYERNSIEFKSSLFYSDKYDTRNQTDHFILDINDLPTVSNDTVDIYKVSSHSELSHYFSSRLSNHASVDFSYLSNAATKNNFYLSVADELRIKRNSFEFRPALGLIYSKADAAVFIEPGLLIRKKFSKHYLDFNFSKQSQQQQAVLQTIHFQRNNGIADLLESTRSYNYTLSVRFNELGKDDNNNFQARIFYNDISNLVVSTDQFFNAFNDVDFLPEDNLINNGDARTYGLELIYNHQFGNSTFLNLNTSFFDATTGATSLDRANAKYNFGYVSNFTFSKNFQVKGNLLYLSFAGHFRGGAYDYIIDEEQSRAEQTTRYSLNQQQLNSYYRLDLRINYRFRDKNFIILDIQNLTSVQNDAYYFYDPVQDAVVLEKQLGMIPVLSYKRVF